MTTAVSPLLGRPVWYELMTSDPAAAESFYKNVVGWTSAPFEGSPNPYTVFKRSGQVQVAGLLKTPAGMNMPSVLEHVCGRAEARGRRGAHQAAWRQGTVARHRGPLGWPDADDEGPARRRLLHHSAGAAEEDRPETGARNRRRLLARTDDHRRPRGDEVLSRESSAGSPAKRWTWVRWANIRCSTARTA